MDEKVSTIVRFKDNRRSSMTPLPVMTEINDRSVLQRRIYLVLNAFIVIVIVLPNIFDIFLEKEDFAYHLLFMFHATCLLLFFVSTAIFRNVGDGITTITSLTLFVIYKTIHYIIRYRHCHIDSRQGFLISTIQLTVLLIFTITAILWTYLLIRKKYQKINTKKMKDYETKQKRIFYSFLALNLMLTISSLILNIRTQENFGLYHIIILSVGIPLALLWCTIGVLMSIYKNCLCISSFYFLSLLQPLHLIWMIFQLLNEWNGLGTENETNQLLSLFIIIFVCVCTNFLVHLLTTIVACWMISRTEKRIFNTRWMFTSI